MSTEPAWTWVSTVWRLVEPAHQEAVRQELVSYAVQVKAEGGKAVVKVVRPGLVECEVFERKVEHGRLD